MRILWSIHLYPPKHNCGSEFVAHHVNKFLISKGHQCRVLLYYGHNNGIKSDYNYEGVDCMVGKEITSLDTYRWADICMTHLDITQRTIVMAAGAGKPTVHFVHNDIPYESILQSNVNTTHIVYNSDWIKNKIGYPQNSYTLHPPCNFNDYDTTKFDDPLNDRYLPMFPEISDREYITLISLNERKGGYLFYQIAKAMPDRKFLGVMGSYDNPGPLKKSQVDIINDLIQLPNFTLAPNTPDILSTYRRTRLLLMPSDYESWGRTATEAMCSGIPVICTPTLGLKENCQDKAIYVGSLLAKPEPGLACVDIGTVDEWVKAIQEFDDPEYYHKYSVICKARAKQLDPLKELEGLEQFLINVKSSHKYR
jgi:glycosyltransferase involved in cell wall biosynthesis